MYKEDGTTVVRKRLSCFSVLILSLTAIIITVVVTASGIAVYALSVVDEKTDSLVGLVGEAARALPELREALPPALADALDDERSPEYVDQLEVAVRAGGEDRWGRQRCLIEVENTGDKVVSLLSMRVVGLDDDGDMVYERNTWAATPIQIEDEWRGPLLPHETRRFSVWSCREGVASKITHEITDVRIWSGRPALQADEPIEAEL
jgi:hypothetical protein